MSSAAYHAISFAQYREAEANCQTWSENVQLQCGLVHILFLTTCDMLQRATCRMFLCCILLPLFSQVFVFPVGQDPRSANLGAQYLEPWEDFHNNESSWKEVALYYVLPVVRSGVTSWRLAFLLLRKSAMAIGSFSSTFVGEIHTPATMSSIDMWACGA